MTKKRVLRWVIVLFLLAALPVMTAVMAQGQEPAAKQLPVVTEPGESQSPVAYDLYESEANNTRATADETYLGYVMAGKIGQAGDVDYFKIDHNAFSEYYLIDIDAMSMGSQLDAVVCLVTDYDYTLDCNDDADGFDSLLFTAVGDWYSGDYYVKVFDYMGDGGSGYYYQLFVSTPVLVSAAAGGLGTGTVAGISFKSGDVLAWSDLQFQPDKWHMFFDASDVGVKTLSNLAIDGWEDRMLFSVNAAQTLPGIGTVKPQDIITFTPGETDLGYQDGYGPNTAGSFDLTLPGWENDLTTSTEKLDALDGFYHVNFSHVCDGYPISTVGLAIGAGFSETTIIQDDEDVFCIWVEYQPGWNRFFDVNGTNDGPSPGTVPGLPKEDVNGTAFLDTYDRLALSITGTGNIFGHVVNQKDIFSINKSDYTWGGYLWRGPQHGWKYNLDAFEMSDYEYLYAQGTGPDGTDLDTR